MLQLLERQVGCDAHAIGFPSVDTCLAIVVQTTAELIGWHSLNTDPVVTRANTKKFRAYIAAKAAGHAVRLYVATNRANHARDWRDELTNIGEKLHFHGPATAIDLKVNSEGVYVQFERDPGDDRCRIFYKRNSKIDYDSGKTRLLVDTVRHSRLLTGANTTFGALHPGDDGKTTVYTTVTPSDASAKGRLNAVSWTQMNTITIA